jgi:acetylornithine deacetylase/succinyl-diaminopimelate desuccinylase-like protein
LVSALLWPAGYGFRPQLAAARVRSGATGPDVFERTLGMPSIGIPMGNHDNNQHSFNENLRIQNLWDGIELMAALLTM